MAQPTLIQIAQAVLAEEARYVGQALPQIRSIEQVAQWADRRYFVVGGIQIRKASIYEFAYAVVTREDGDILTYFESGMASAKAGCFDLCDADRTNARQEA